MGTGAPGAPPEPGGAWSAWALREEERVTRSGGDGHPGEQDASSSRSNMGHGLLVKNSSSESAAQPRRVAAWCWGRGPSPLSSRLGRVPAGQCPSSAGDRASDGRGGGALSRQQGAPHAPSFCLILWGSSLAPAATLDLAGAGVGDDSPVAHSPPGGRARVHSLRGRLFLAHSGARQSLGDHMGPQGERTPPPTRSSVRAAARTDTGQRPGRQRRLSSQVHARGPLLLHRVRGLLQPPGRGPGGVVWLPPVRPPFSLENDAKH